MVIVMSTEFLTGKEAPPPTVITTDLLCVSSSLSSTDVGFILVIDRRQDRWAAVKGTLLRIAVSDGGTHTLCWGFGTLCTHKQRVEVCPYPSHLLFWKKELISFFILT